MFKAAGDGPVRHWPLKWSIASCAYEALIKLLVAYSVDIGAITFIKLSNVDAARQTLSPVITLYKALN